MAIHIACASSASKASSAPGDRGRTIEHLIPARDSVGSAPARFSWTAVVGADSYSIGVWNEVDVLIWRQDHLAAPSVTRPEEVRLEPGTYLWSISALREGLLVAESGLAAFVVR